MTPPLRPEVPEVTPEHAEAARVSPEDRERAAIRWERDTSPTGRNLLDAEEED